MTNANYRALCVELRHFAALYQQMCGLNSENIYNIHQGIPEKGGEAMTTPLSPAAQAMVEAFCDRYEELGPLECDWQKQCLAAALCAAALHLDNDCLQLLAIAAELEAQP